MRQPFRTAAIIATAAVLAWAILLSLWLKSDRHPRPTEPVKADAVSAPASIDSLARSIRSEVGQVDRLSVRQVEGIVIIRGRVSEPNAIEQVSQIAKERGFHRVANLIELTPVTNDEAIEREAERELGQNRALDGCRFHLESSNGILTVSGVVQRELQKDLARDLLRRVPGVKEVRSELKRL